MTVEVDEVVSGFFGTSRLVFHFVDSHDAANFDAFDPHCEFFG
jgi:hypothetical protein